MKLFKRKLKLVLYLEELLTKKVEFLGKEKVTIGDKTYNTLKFNLVRPIQVYQKIKN